MICLSCVFVAINQIRKCNACDQGTLLGGSLQGKIMLTMRSVSLVGAAQYEKWDSLILSDRPSECWCRDSESNSLFLAITVISVVPPFITKIFRIDTRSVAWKLIPCITNN